MRRNLAALALLDRLCRPQRVALFGHRAVGKTTLLTVLYREATEGKLPELRLAAGDVRTADYLSDKIAGLGSGQPLPATLAETDLLLTLYHHERRIPIRMRDYQGEHIELGRAGSVQDYLRDCDAALLCLDVATMPEPTQRLRRQQEIEKLVEEYLAGAERPVLERPLALVLTKADLLDPSDDDLDTLTHEYFGMTSHALRTHAPGSGVFAVSSLAGTGLADPLVWLATRLQVQDESRVARLWEMATNNVRVLERAVVCFAHRYPDAPATARFQDQLRYLRRQRRRRRSLATCAAAACLLVAAWSYDALGYQAAKDFEAAHVDDPSAVMVNWESFQYWHPGRHVSGVISADGEERQREEWSQRIREQDRDRRLAELRLQAADPDADPEASWRQFGAFRTAHPEVDLAGDLEQLRALIKKRRDEQLNTRAERAYDEFRRAAERTDDLPAVIVLADSFLRDFSGTPPESEVRRCRELFVRRLDERDIQTARDFSAVHPLKFATRREHYQHYLEKHPGGGGFAHEAEAALRQIADQWDKHDFRQVRDRFVKEPGNVAAIASLCRQYLASHPGGRFRASATELLRFGERISSPGDYRVVLHNGHFDKSAASYFSRGPKLSVEIEVAGIRYGPSTIASNNYDPEWNFEFPRRVRWKLGEAVVIRVTEHSWRNTVVFEAKSDGDDPLALRLLAGQIFAGNNYVNFGTDFSIPTLPEIE